MLTSLQTELISCGVRRLFQFTQNSFKIYLEKLNHLGLDPIT